MNDSATRRRVWSCPPCGQTNTLVSNEVPDTADVDCSRCGRRIGLWCDVKGEGRRELAGE